MVLHKRWDLEFDDGINILNKKRKKVKSLISENINNNKGESTMDLTTVNFKDLLDEIKRRNTFPSQVFTVKELEQDKEFKPMFEELKTTKESLKEKESKIIELETEKKQLDGKLLLTTAEQRLKNKLKDNKLTERQVNYIVDKFDESIDDASDEGLEKFINKRLAEYKRNANFFGIDDNSANLPNDTGRSDSEDYTKSSNNPLLDEDFEEVN